MRLPALLLTTLLAGCGVAAPSVTRVVESYTPPSAAPDGAITIHGVKSEEGWLAGMSFEADFSVRGPRVAVAGGTAQVTFYERRTEGLEFLGCLFGCPEREVSQRLAVGTTLPIPALAPGALRRFKAEAVSKEDPWKAERRQLNLLGGNATFDYRAEIKVNWY